MFVGTHFSNPISCCTFNPMIRLSLVGTGNLGWNLIHNFQNAPGIDLHQVVDRSDRLDDQSGIHRIREVSEMQSTDICILAVKDSDILPLSKELKDLDSLIVHCSGATPLSVLDDLKRYGVWYPLQTFSRDFAVELNGVPIALESNAKSDYQLLEKLALAVDAKPIAIDSEQRSSLHLAAVMVNNFVNHLFSLGKEVVSDQGLDFDLLIPLIEETVRKAGTKGPKESQTGPAVREDQVTIHKHLEALNQPTTQEVYRILTRSIIEFHGKKL